MNSTWVFLMALAVLGVSAKPQTGAAFQSDSFINGACGSSVPSVKTQIRTSVVENPTVHFPTFIPPTTVSQSCHCLRTVVRPQIRNEIITVPTVDRIVRTIATPIVETIDCGGGSPLGVFPRQSILSELSGNRGVFQNNISTLGGNNNGLFGKENARSFSARHSSNSANGGSLNKSNRVSGDVISQPPVSAFPDLNGKNFLGSIGAIFSGNSGFIKNGHILSF